jgi:ABC-type multidrug transport system permease subunit
MAQALLITTLLSIAGLTATSIMGFMASPQHVATHILVALVTVVAGLFSQSMTLFFFIGTGKQLKDKTQGSPDADAVRNATRALTMRVSPAATYAMVLLMITFIMGGGVAAGRTPHWLHISLSIATVAMYGRAYWVELQAMMENAGLMEKYLRDE